MHVIARPAFKDAVKTPYTYFLYSFMKQLGVAVSEYSTRDVMLRRPDILHIHWPDSLLELQTAKRAMISARKFYTILFLARKLGVKLIWTVHDLVPHDFIYPEIERPFWNWTINQMDGIIALTTKGLLMAQERYPSLRATPSFVIPHGHFRDAYPRVISREHARSSLGIAPTRRVITYFGHIRPYKNIPQLIRAFRAMDDQEAALFICGRVGNRVNCEDEIRREAEGDPRVHLVLRYIEPSEIQVYLAAADLLAFPYSDILNSGSAILALSHDRPILVPNLGALPELRAAVGKSMIEVVYMPKYTPAMYRQNELFRRLARAPFGKLPDGTAIESFTLRNAHGIEVRAITYGAIIVSLRVPDRAGLPPVGLEPTTR